MNPERSRLKTIGFLKKFRDHRRNYDAYSKDSDLAALRKRERSFSGYFLAPCLLVLFLSSHWSGWAIVAAVFALGGAIAGFLEQRKIRRALALFDECAPQDIDEVLRRIGGEGEFPSRIPPPSPTQTAHPAGMAELVDAPDLGSGIERCAGSSPVPGTSKLQTKG